MVPTVSEFGLTAVRRSCGGRGGTCNRQSVVWTWGLLLDQFQFLFIGPGGREDFAGAEVVEEGVAADGAGLPRGDEGLDFVRREHRGIEIGVEFVAEMGGGHGLRRGFGGVPPIDPAQDGVQGRGDGSGDARDDAALAHLPDGEGLGAFGHAALAFQQARAEHGEEAFGAVERAFKGREALALELQKAGRRAEGVRDPRGRRADAELRVLVEAGDEGGGERGEVHPVLVINVQAVVIEVGGHEVFDGGFTHVGARVFLAMKHEGDAGEGFLKSMGAAAPRQIGRNPRSPTRRVCGLP